MLSVFYSEEKKNKKRMNFHFYIILSENKVYLNLKEILASLKGDLYMLICFLRMKRDLNNM